MRFFLITIPNAQSTEMLAKICYFALKSVPMNYTTLPKVARVEKTMHRFHEDSRTQKLDWYLSRMVKPKNRQSPCARSSEGPKKQSREFRRRNKRGLTVLLYHQDGIFSETVRWRVMWAFRAIL